MLSWSELSYVEAGLLQRGDWQCERIAAAWKQDSSVPRPEDLYRQEFSVNSPSNLSGAHLYVTAQGVYEVGINGKRVSDQFLATGWSAYEQRLHYQVYDVLDLSSTERAGNCIDIRAAEGWFCGRIGFEGGRRNIWGDGTAVTTQLEVRYGDGSTDVIRNNDLWEVAFGPIRLAEIYRGKNTIATSRYLSGQRRVRRRRIPRAFGPKQAPMGGPPTSTELLAMTGPPSVVFHILYPLQAIMTPKGKLLLDFGQNLVGYTHIKYVKCEKGPHYYAFRRQGARARRVCSASSPRSGWPRRVQAQGFPRKVGHGSQGSLSMAIDMFRSTAYPNLDPLASFEAVVVYTEMEPAGEFLCSNKMLNKLHEKVPWGMRGNLVGLPTDCPQRDERLGWTGDIAVLAPTACFLHDYAGLLKSWLADMALDQSVMGGIPPMVSPNVL